MICHGTPSPLLWKKNVEYIEKKKHLKLTDVNFRCKKFGGHSSYGILYQRNRKLYYVPKECDPYFQIFLQDLSLRPSCYKCRFKGIDRCSDITLGDFWGIEEFAPNLSDGNGSSIIIVHSTCGKNLLEKINDSLDITEIDASTVFSTHNRAMCESSRLPKERQEFWNDCYSLDSKKLFKKYAKVSSKEKTKWFLTKLGLLDIIRKRRKIGGVVTSNDFGMPYHFKKYGE